MERSERQARCQSRLEPALTGALEPHRDDRLARALGGAATDRQPSPQARRVANAPAVVAQVLEVTRDDAQLLAGEVEHATPSPEARRRFAVDVPQRAVPDELVEATNDSLDRGVAAIQVLIPRSSQLRAGSAEASAQLREPLV